MSLPQFSGDSPSLLYLIFCLLQLRMAAAAAVDNIHNSIRTLSQTKRIRVTEFFQDFDKLRSGFVTGILH